MRPTDRQLEVLAAYVNAGTYKRAADHLGLKVTTIRNHLQQLRLGVGTVNTMQALVVCVQEGWIDIPRRVANDTDDVYAEAPGT